MGVQVDFYFYIFLVKKKKNVKLIRYLLRNKELNENIVNVQRKRKV